MWMYGPYGEKVQLRRPGRLQLRCAPQWNMVGDRCRETLYRGGDAGGTPYWSNRRRPEIPWP